MLIINFLKDNYSIPHYQSIWIEHSWWSLLYLVVVSRSLLTFFTGMDVPLLCSPVPFQNAALSAPEVCKIWKQGSSIEIISHIIGLTEVQIMLKLTLGFISTWIFFFFFFFFFWSIMLETFIAIANANCWQNLHCCLY